MYVASYYKVKSHITGWISLRLCVILFLEKTAWIVETGNPIKQIYQKMETS